MGHYTASMKRVREIAMKMEGCMGWTKEKPVKPGWYWWRSDNAKEPRCRKICEYHDRMVMIIAGNYAEIGGGEWQGPIRPEP